MKKPPIAIIGIGCRFPRAQDPKEFWDLLRGGVDAVTPAPLQRSMSSHQDSNDSANSGDNRIKEGGFLEQVDQFEPSFFGISPREAQFMDPQHRLLLETTWEALENAGQVPAQLVGTRTGVFIGISLNDYSHYLWGGATTKPDKGSDALFLQTGTSQAIAANRLSYFFNLHGPSISFNTACSSSLVAIHQACQSLWTEESTLALAGGITLLLFPKVTERLAQAGLLSPDGRCRSFDAEGKGFVRGEGVGMVVLKPVSQAIANEDAIYAVIRGSVMNQDGRSNGITAPNRHAQEALLTEAYRQANVTPDDIQYVEANGTGTVLGDSIEARALGTVLNQRVRRRNPCILGSVKTNIGHLEAASGIASLIKVALSLQEKQIPPNLHFKVPNPYVDFNALGLRVPQTLESWPDGRDARLAGVNSFGFGGTNVHVVLEEFLPDSVQLKKEGRYKERPYYLFTLRARDKPALQELMSKYAAYLSSESIGMIGDICFTANTGRTDFSHRIAIVTKSVVQLREQLEQAPTEDKSTDVLRGVVTKETSNKVAFLFSSEGTEYINMGRQLYDTLPAFRDALEQCIDILDTNISHPLLAALYPGSLKSRSFQSPAHAPLALFCVEWALVQTWKKWGVEPKIVMGYGVGEYTAACVAGVLTLKDALQLVIERSLLVCLQKKSQSPDTGDGLKIEPRMSSLDGMDASNIFDGNGGVKQLKHVLASMKLSEPKMPCICSLTGKLVAGEWTDPEYWIKQMQETYPKMLDARGEISLDDANVVIEIGPQSIKKSKLTNNEPTFSVSQKLWCASLSPEQEDWKQMFRSLGTLFVRGIKVDWRGIDPENSRKRLRLPTYPFQRQRYWLENNPPENDCDTRREIQGLDNEKNSQNIFVSQEAAVLENMNIHSRITEKEAKIPADFSSQNSGRGLEGTAHLTEPAKVLRNIWKIVLDIDEVSLHDNFFELGGNSLLATQANSRMHEIFHVDLPISLFFENPTVAELLPILKKLPQKKQLSGKDSLSQIIHEGPLPLSFAQQRFWFLEQVVQGQGVFCIPVLLRLRGIVDIKALEQSFQWVARRHDILRTCFPDKNGTPIQLIAPDWKSTLSLIPVEGQTELERTVTLARLIDECIQHPFDLCHGPLMKTTLLQLSQTESVLVITFHHIVSDGWSIGVFQKDLMTAYNAYAHDLEPQLPPLSIQYADYTLWQREWLKGERLEEELNFWISQLVGAPILCLPTDRPRPPAQTHNGDTHIFTLSANLTTTLNTVSRQEGCTLFMTLLAAFQTLLHRYTQQDDVVVGSPIAGRTQPDLEGVVGLFINTLVLRTRFSASLSFREVLQQVREITLSAYDHQLVPFEQLLEHLKIERNLSYPPLFQVLFVFQNLPSTNLKLKGLTVSPMSMDNGGAMVDVTFSFQEKHGQLHGWVKYNTDLFDRSTIMRMCGHFETLLVSLIANLEQPVQHLPLLTDSERQQLLIEWNQSRTCSLSTSDVVQLFERQVDRTPEAIALACADEQLSYAILNAKANQLAHHLHTLGVGPEVRVGLCLERSLDLLIGLWGILKTGGAYVPLDPTYPTDRLQFILKDAHISILVTHRSLHEMVSAFSECFHIVDLETDQSHLSRHTTKNLPQRVTMENLAYLIYTSGSTGQPKGVMIPHGALVNYVETTIHDLPLGGQDRVLQFASISFDASAEEIYPCLTSGGTLVLRTDTLLDSWRSFIDHCEITQLTVLDLPTAVWHELIANMEGERLRLPSGIRVVIIGGERARPERLAQWHQLVPDSVQLVNTYGPTEGTIVAIKGRLQNTHPSKVPHPEVPLGTVFPHVQAYVVDQAGYPVPIGFTGECLLGGRGLARGYVNGPGGTAAKFQPDPFGQEPGARLYQTGDLMRYRADGCLNFVRRADHQVKLRGFRIELGEIETRLRQHPIITDVAVIVYDQEINDVRIVAYLVANDDEAFSPPTLRTYLAQWLPSYMLPAAFVLLPTLPMTPNGKLDRQALPSPQSSRSSMAHPIARVSTPVEDQLAQIWCTLLKVDHVGINESFFELGGHSLLLTQLANRIKETFHIRLPLRILFNVPTIEQLAYTIVEYRVATADSAMVNELLAKIEQLTPTQVRELLKQDT